MPSVRQPRGAKGRPPRSCAAAMDVFTAYYRFAERPAACAP